MKVVQHITNSPLVLSRLHDATIPKHYCNWFNWNFKCLLMLKSPQTSSPRGKYIYICIRSWNPENNGMSAAPNSQPRTRTPVRVMELLYSIKPCMFSETAAGDSDIRNTSCRPFVKGDNQILDSAFSARNSTCWVVIN